MEGGSDIPHESGQRQVGKYLRLWGTWGLKLAIEIDESRRQYVVDLNEDRTSGSLFVWRFRRLLVGDDGPGAEMNYG